MNGKFNSNNFKMCLCYITQVHFVESVFFKKTNSNIFIHWNAGLHNLSVPSAYKIYSAKSHAWWFSFFIIFRTTTIILNFNFEFFSYIFVQSISWFHVWGVVGDWAFVHNVCFMFSIIQHNFPDYLSLFDLPCLASK